MASLAHRMAAEAGPISTSTIAAVAVAAFVCYQLAHAIYNVWLHPLSKVPGPWLAGATQWYETYWEIIPGGGGAFTKHIKALHGKYGPIVRINPNEVHIDDPEYYETIYAPSQPYDKLWSFQERFNMPKATFMTANAQIHKVRRNALAPFFATNKIRNHGPFMQGLVDTISHRLKTQYSGKRRVLTLNDVFGCLAGDVITNLAFARSYHLVESEKWDSPFTNAVSNLVHSSHYMTQFVWLIPVMNAIPDKIVSTLVPAFAPIIDFRVEMEKQIRDILSGKNTDIKEASHKTIFAEILESGVPATEVTELRLQNEAVSVVGAGFETTRWILTIASYNILANPAILERLKAELNAACPDADNMPAWKELAQLPWLSACIEEALRLGYGIVQRSPRISRHSAFVYKDFVLPPGTGVSSDAYHMHHHEDIFPDSYTYKPERWLGEPRAPSGKLLSRYNVAFGRGSRACLGLPMAYCEMYICLASLFRRFDFELFETGPEDVVFHHDMVTPQPAYGSKGVRVLVK